MKWTPSRTLTDSRSHREQLLTFKDVEDPEKSQTCWASPTKLLFAFGVLVDGLGALAYGVLSQLTRQEGTDGCLNLPGGDGVTLIVMSEMAGLGRDASKDVVHEGVHDRHGL